MAAVLAEKGAGEHKLGYKHKVFGLTRVELDHGYWVDVAPLTKGEDDECQRALLGGDLEGVVGTDTLRARFHQRDYTDKQLLYAVKGWNLDDDDGKVLPITLEHIQGLADGHATKLLRAVRALTNPLAEPEKRQD